MQHYSTYLIPAILIAFGVYRRIRRTIGSQKLSYRRLRVRMILFSVIALLILSAGLVHPILFAADAVGFVLGTGLALLAIRYLAFEKRENGWYYRTHRWVEVTVLVLFLGRIVYRFAIIFQAGGDLSAMQQDSSGLTRDPITSAVLFVIVAYYLIFFGYVMSKGKQVEASAAAPAGPQTNA